MSHPTETPNTAWRPWEPYRREPEDPARPLDVESARSIDRARVAERAEQMRADFRAARRR